VKNVPKLLYVLADPGGQSSRPQDEEAATGSAAETPDSRKVDTFQGLVDI